MTDKKKGTILNWEEFRNLGNPENVPIEDEIVPSEAVDHTSMKLRIYIDKKNRRGKVATIIRGWDGSTSKLNELGKELKSKCGVGGTTKNNEIIIQGNHRDKVIKILLEKGFVNTKPAGG